MKIAYEQQSNKTDAYDAVKAAITPEMLKKFQVHADLLYNSDEIIAKGKGFELKMQFEQTSCDLDLTLSLMLKPFKSKILSTLEREIKKVV